jgi:hypothetical protein
LIAAGDLLWGLDVDSGRVRWFVGQPTPDSITHGRAALAGGLVYWPRREEIQLVETGSGLIQREIDLKDQHGIPGGGNITLADGCLILAQANRLSVFSEFGSLRKQREDQLSLRPDDPVAHLAVARIAEAQHDWSAALSAYEHFRLHGEREPHQLGQSAAELAMERRARILEQQGNVVAALAEWEDLQHAACGSDHGELISPQTNFPTQQRARQELERLRATQVGADGISRSLSVELRTDAIPVEETIIPRSQKGPATDEVAAPPIVRDWERRIRTGKSVLFVEGAADDRDGPCVLINGSDVVCCNWADGSERWRIPVAEPVQWAGHSGGLIVLGTSASISGIDARKGAIVWHRRFPAVQAQSRANETVSFQRSGSMIHCRSKALGFVPLAGVNGTLQWVSQSPDAVTQFVHSSSEHSRSALAGNASTPIRLVEDGILARIDHLSGKRVWSRRVGPALSSSPPPAVCTDDHHAYVVTAGIVRAFLLNNGELAWELYVGPPQDEWRIQRTGPWLTLVPMTISPQRRIILCDPVQGRCVARIRCEGNRGGAQFRAVRDRVLVATDSHLTGYRRIDGAAE